MIDLILYLDPFLVLAIVLNVWTNRNQDLSMVSGFREKGRLSREREDCSRKRGSLNKREDCHLKEIIKKGLLIKENCPTRHLFNSVI